MKEFKRMWRLERGDLIAFIGIPEEETGENVALNTGETWMRIFQK